MLACYLGNGFSLLHHLYHAHVVSGCYATIGNDVQVQTMSLPHLGVRQPEEGEEREGGEGGRRIGSRGNRGRKEKEEREERKSEEWKRGKKREERRERRSREGGEIVVI